MTCSLYLETRWSQQAVWRSSSPLQDTTGISFSTAASTVFLSGRRDRTCAQDPSSDHACWPYLCRLLLQITLMGLIYIFKTWKRFFYMTAVVSYSIDSETWHVTQLHDCVRCVWCQLHLFLKWDNAGQTFDQPSFFFCPPTSKLLHKTSLEIKRPHRHPYSLQLVHSRTLLLLQLLPLLGQRLQIATAPSHSHSLFFINGQVPGCLLKISLTNPGQGEVVAFSVWLINSASACISSQ